MMRQRQNKHPPRTPLGRKGQIAAATLVMTYVVSTVALFIDKMTAAEWISLIQIFAPTMLFIFTAGNAVEYFTDKGHYYPLHALVKNQPILPEHCMPSCHEGHSSKKSNHSPKS